MSKTISAGRNPKIYIENIGGDLSLVGWDGEDILIKGDDETTRISQNGAEMKISCDDDLSIRVPTGASLFIATIEGDASIRRILGSIEIKEINGDLSIRDVNSVAIDAVQSDFSLRGAKGNLFIKEANGDATLREIDGNVNLKSVGNDLALRDVHGDVIANVGNDIVFYLNPQPRKNYTIAAGDDILLVMPPKANATLTMSANEISVDWKGSELEDDATAGTIIFGDGSANIALTASNDIRVSNQADAGDFAADFGNFAGIGMDWSGFGERISRQVEKVTRRATKQADEAIRRAEENRKRFEDRAKRHMRGKLNLGIANWKWDASSGGVQMQPQQQVSEEERMSILRMLQDKKITAEEAESLLSALEGGA